MRSSGEERDQIQVDPNRTGQLTEQCYNRGVSSNALPHSEVREQVTDYPVDLLLERGIVDKVGYP
jgi:hypothetical protein